MLLKASKLSKSISSRSCALLVSQNFRLQSQVPQSQVTANIKAFLNTEQESFNQEQISEEYLQKQREQEKAESEWLERLKSTQQKKSIFGMLSETKPEDHHHLKYIKSKIAKLVRQELDYLQFQDKLQEEEHKRVTSDVYEEVMTKQNFYFAIDENKFEKNLKIFSKKCPGNAHRHPSVILPHENVHIQRWFNTKDMTSDKLFEIYAYYSHLIDLHISQIRPQNLNDYSYIPHRFNRVQTVSGAVDDHLNNIYFDYYHRWREPTRKWFSQTQEIDFWETLKNRPTTSHYDHDKGSKYDVEWTEDQKFPHVADRLGYPIFREEPIEKILSIERAPAHPGYQYQPFVQTPSMDPDPTLSFQLGETIYENRNVLEWNRFWKVITASTLLTYPIFYTFEIYAADGVPSLSWMADNWNFWQIPQQFQDGSGWGLEGVRYPDDHDYMNIQYVLKRSIVRPSNTFYMVSILAFMQHINFDYVTKIIYNRDKDLVFVYKPDGLWNETEHVHEMHHLEQVVPAPVTSYKDLTMNRNDGILNICDMNTKDHLRLYNEDKFWNLDLKEDFLSQTRSLWKGRDSKYDGQLFDITHRASDEITMTQMKVDRELQEAIKKHGQIQQPKRYEDTFYEKINNKKREALFKAASAANSSQ